MPPLLSPTGRWAAGAFRSHGTRCSRNDDEELIHDTSMRTMDWRAPFCNREDGRERHVGRWSSFPTQGPQNCPRNSTTPWIIIQGEHAPFFFITCDLSGHILKDVNLRHDSEIYLRGEDALLLEFNSTRTINNRSTTDNRSSSSKKRRKVWGGQLVTQEIDVS